MRRAAVFVLGAVVSACLSSCANEKHEAAPVAAALDAGPTIDLASLRRAEDQRLARAVDEAATTSHDPRVRRASARALARIGDPASLEALVHALEDEDPEASAWGAYGLGRACKGKEDVVVKALAARVDAFGADAGSGARNAIDPRVAIVRAIGRCGGPIAEAALASWVRRRDAVGEGAAYALGDVAARRGVLADDTMTALLDAATIGTGAAASPLEAALYPFGRMEHVSAAFAPRVAKAAVALFGTRGDARTFAIRALGRTGSAAAGDLAHVVLDRSLSPAQRGDAARALRQVGDEGREAAAEALVQLAPTKDAFDFVRVAGDDFGVLSALVAALGPDVPKKSEASLFALASLTAPGSPPPSLARRLAELRCGAAAALAKGAYDSDVLKRCDVESSEASQRARLAALLRRSLVAERRAAWRAFTKSDHVKVREAAVEAIAQHPELADAARAALAEALAAKKGGIVATAAEVVHAHPDRVLVVSDRDRRAALDPSSPAPTVSAGRVVDPAVASALGAALAREWPEDLVETRAALLDAAVAVSLDGARAAALAACHDRNVTMRERATKALRELGDAALSTSPHPPTPDAGACGPPSDPAPPAAELDHPLEQDTRVTLSTDAGDLSIVFEPALAPVSATRFVALAKAGFYDGIVVHRVVPGFVAQFGDPDGDGYGGAGTLLRCETSPVPFGPLDVGVALSGRDTGSSQLFVALARYPHLDGEYARVGHAEGDWWSLAEGDAIRSVKVDDAAPRASSGR